MSTSMLKINALKRLAFYIKNKILAYGLANSSFFYKMVNIHKRLHAQLTQRSEEGTLRQLKRVEGLVDFSSNDYLGLAQNSELARSVMERHKASGLRSGSSGSRLLTGNSSLVEKLEEKLAKRFRGQAALLFNSGYIANMAIVSTIPQRGDTIIYDSAIHACIKEGARLSKAKHYSFKHNDADDLRNKLEKASGTAFVVMESLYSMDGDWVHFETIYNVCKEFQAQMIIDEAHSTGWFGENGCGWTCQNRVEDRFMARVYTFGKALGTHGACVVGDQLVIDYLINFARPFIYTTALPDVALMSIDGAWDYLENNPQETDRLHENINIYAQMAATELGISINSQSPIQCLRVGSNEEGKLLSKQLQENGIDVRPILPPTVKVGTERLRICLHSFNTEEEIARLIATIKSLV